MTPRCSAVRVLVPALLAGVLPWPAFPQSGCDYGPSYTAASWTCAGGTAAGSPCSYPGDPVCVGGSCQIGTGGRATFYDNVGGGNCGLDTDPGAVYVTAIAEPDWEGSAMCGRCLEVTGPKGTIVAKVVDRCPAPSGTGWCADGGHLDLDDRAFAAVANPAQGIVEVSWRTVPCEWPGNVRVINKDGINPWWYALFVDDHRHGIASVAVHDADSTEWRAAERQSYNAWVITFGGAGLDLPVSIRLTDVTGAQVERTGVVTALTEYAIFDMGAQLAPCFKLYADGFETGDTSMWSGAAP